MSNEPRILTFLREFAQECPPEAGPANISKAEAVELVDHIDAQPGIIAVFKIVSGALQGFERKVRVYAEEYAKALELHGDLTNAGYMRRMLSEPVVRCSYSRRRWGVSEPGHGPLCAANDPTSFYQAVCDCGTEPTDRIPDEVVDRALRAFRERLAQTSYEPAYALEVLGRVAMRAALEVARV